MKSQKSAKSKSTSTKRGNENLLTYDEVVELENRKSNITHISHCEIGFFRGLYFKGDQIHYQVGKTSTQVTLPESIDLFSKMEGKFLTIPQCDQSQNYPELKKWLKMISDAFTVMWKIDLEPEERRQLAKDAKEAGVSVPFLINDRIRKLLAKKTQAATA